MSKQNKLTDELWKQIFKIRCRAKSGQSISSFELKILERAISEDRSRYEAMSADVFDATVPFGSAAKAKREPIS